LLQVVIGCQREENEEFVLLLSNKVYKLPLPLLLLDFRKSWNPSGAHMMLIGCWNMTWQCRKTGSYYRVGRWRWIQN